MKIMQDSLEIEQKEAIYMRHFKTNLVLGGRCADLRCLNPLL